MPRIARKYFNGNIFHVMVQGINKEKIFESEYYKKKYREILKHNINNIQIIAYCLMDNHAHILVYTEDIKYLSKFMQKVNTKYAVDYNKLNNRVGYVFRNRFNIQEITDEKHLKNCIVYIHKNPLKAGIVKHEKEYKFSSYNEYIKESDIISKDIIKLIFGVENEKRLKEIICSMHLKDITENFIDVKMNIDYIEIMKSYKDKGLNKKMIIKRLKKDYSLSERTIAELTDTTRHTVRKILK